MFKTANEGNANIHVPSEEKVSKELPVFYNPVMKFNRDVSLLLLKVLDKKGMMIADPLAGTGVRGIRFLLELPAEMIEEVQFNDINPEAVKLIKKNLLLNKIKSKASVFCKDANMFLLESNGYDYIDVDPFGSPNFLLNSAIVRLSRDGILAVTATDTGCLCGSFPSACMRKYWAVPSRDETMHENGLRILIRKVQLIGAEHDKALIPVYSYSREHYFRVFFICSKGKHKVDLLLKMHGMIDDAGPMWLGKLWDKEIAIAIVKEKADKFLWTIKEEAKIDAVGFYNIPKICKKNKISMIKKEEIFSRIRKRGYDVSETHFLGDGLRSNIPEKELIEILK